MKEKEPVFTIIESEDRAYSVDYKADKVVLTDTNGDKHYFLIEKQGT